MEEHHQYLRYVQTSVTCFLYHQDEYLFLHRDPHKRIDPGRLNAIGGRVEPGENYLGAAVREITEETGYQIDPQKMQFIGIIKLEGGYQEDWIACFFKVPVPDKKIPLGTKTKDGRLIWLRHDQVLISNYELVDDLYYCFEDIVKGDKILFITAKTNKKHKIYDISISKLSLPSGNLGESTSGGRRRVKSPIGK